MVNLITENIGIWTTAQIQKANGGRGNGSANQSLYGIQKLRELILGMALRGLFNKKNESLSKTINQDIDSARIEYFKSIGKKPKVYDFGPPLLDEFVLPKGWMWMRVGELCDLQTGATPSTQKPNYFGGDIRWLVSGDINQGVIEDCEGRITADGLASSNCKILPPYTVLIALNGQGKTRGTVALLKVPAACNQSLVGMIPFDSSILDPKFLLLSLNYRYCEIRDITGQKQRRGLNMGLVSELSIPLSPLVEQYRIVAKVNELMALCDQLEQQQTDSNAAHKTLVETLLATLTTEANQGEFAEAWQRIVAHFDTLFTTEQSIDQLKQTILQLAVMGKLVPQNPNDEPASVLLEKISNEKARLIKAGKVKKEKPLPEIGEAEKPFELPRGWQFVRLSDLSQLITKGSSPNWQGVAYTENPEDVLFITSENVCSYVLDLDNKKYVEKKFNDIEPRSILMKGDFLMNIVGASIGRTAIYNIDDLANINQAVCLIRVFTQFLNSKFLLHFFNCAICVSYMFDKQVDNARANLSMGNIAKFAIPFPPLAEQRRIVAKVDELIAICGTLKVRLKEAQTIQIQLADAIVEQAVC